MAVKKKDRKRAVNGAPVPHYYKRTQGGYTYEGYKAKITLGYDASGKQMQKEVRGRTAEECQEAIDALRDALKSGAIDQDELSTVPPSKITVTQWMRHWLKTYCNNIKPGTLANYISVTEHHIIPGIGKVPLAKLTPEKVQKFFNDLANAKTGEPLSASTVQNIWVPLHGALERAVISKKIYSNPASKRLLSLPTYQTEPYTPIEDDMMQALITELRDHCPYYRCVMVMLLLGLRRAEAIGLSWDDVDFKRGTVHVRMQLQHNKITKVVERITPKSRKSRVVYMPDAVVEILQEQKAIQDAEKKEAKKNKKPWENEWNLVFTHADGHHLPSATVYTNFKRRAAAVGIPETKLHDLRHQFATSALGEGADLSSVSKSMGHTKASFTLEKYANATNKMLKETAMSVDRYADTIFQKANAPDEKKPDA